MITKWACLEGTSIIANDFACRLSDMEAGELDEARGFIELVSVVKEGLYAYSKARMQCMTLRRAEYSARRGR